MHIIPLLVYQYNLGRPHRKLTVHAKPIQVEVFVLVVDMRLWCCVSARRRALRR